MSSYPISGTGIHQSRERSHKTKSLFRARSEPRRGETYGGYNLKVTAAKKPEGERIKRGSGELPRGGARAENGRRIVILCSHTPSLFWFRMDMMRTFIEKGWQVTACGNEAESEWKPSFEEQGIAYRQIYVNRNSTNPLDDIRTYRSIKRILAELKPDKIFTFQAKTVIYGGLAARRLKAGAV